MSKTLPNMVNISCTALALEYYTRQTRTVTLWSFGERLDEIMRVVVDWHRVIGGRLHR